MPDYENALPNILTVGCWIIEMVSFMTSYMIESRSLRHLHDGIFHRCVYPLMGTTDGFRCLWWSNDTFWIDPSKLVHSGGSFCLHSIWYFPFFLIQLNNKKSIAEILYMLGVHFAYFHGPIGYFQSWTIVSVHCFLQGNAHHKIQHGYDHWQRFQWYFIIFKTQCKTYDQRVTHFTFVDWNQSIHCSYSYKEYS